jgi:hypothetical protein
LSYFPFTYRCNIISGLFYQVVSLGGGRGGGYRSFWKMRKKSRLNSEKI